MREKRIKDKAHAKLYINVLIRFISFLDNDDNDGDNQDTNPSICDNLENTSSKMLQLSYVVFFVFRGSFVYLALFGISKEMYVKILLDEGHHFHGDFKFLMQR